MTEPDSDVPKSPIVSQAVIVLTILEGRQMRVVSFGSPDMPSREAEELADALAKLFAIIVKNPIPPWAKEDAT